MARYLIVTEMTRPRPDVVMIHFDMRDDATMPHSVVLSGTQGFQAVRYDETGAVVNESLQQRRTRLRAEFDAYDTRMLTQATAGDAQFEDIRSAALGYRFPAAYMASQGPNSPTVGTNSSTEGGAHPWCNPGNILGSDALASTVFCGDPQTLVASGFGFGIPSGATIDGVLVEVEALGWDFSRAALSKVWLADSGTQLGTIDTTSDTLPNTYAYYSRGGSTALWGATLIESIINASTIEVRCSMSYDGPVGNNTTGDVNHIRVTVFYTEGGGGTAHDVSVALAGSSSLSINGEIVVDETPSDLVATALSATSAQLTWSDNTGAEDWYIVERSDDYNPLDPGAATWTQLVGTLSPNIETYTDNTAIPETTHAYRVKWRQVL